MKKTRLTKTEFDNKMKDPRLQEAFLRWISLASSKRCPYCKTEFDEPFFLVSRKGGFNIKTLVHIKQTHGYEPIDVLGFLKDSYGKDYPESMKFFDSFDSLMEALSYR